MWKNNSQYHFASAQQPQMNPTQQLILRHFLSPGAASRSGDFVGKGGR
jgi:hypothetical protein